MRFLTGLTVTQLGLMFLCALGCSPGGKNQDGDYGSRAPGLYESGSDACTAKAKQEMGECAKTYGCLWNYDRCETPPKEVVPNIPDQLRALKVKQISVGWGLCAIDENDELWCLPGKDANNQPIVLPHPNYKFKQVAVADMEGSYSDKVHICATQKSDGRSVCFKKGRSGPIKGPTTESTVKTVPYRYFGTICAFTESKKVVCESEEPIIEKIEDWRVKHLPGDTIKEIFFYPPHSYARIEDYALGVLTAKDDLNRTTANLGYWSGAMVTSPNVQSVSAFENVLCWATKGKNGIRCEEAPSSTLPSHLKDLTEVKNKEIMELAISKNYACAVTTSNDLICWGVQKSTKNIPKTLKAKSVSLSEKLMCLIDMTDKLHCVSTED